MSVIKTITYDLALGSDTLAINTSASDISKVSYQLSGGTANGTATVKLQESNISLTGAEDIVGASAVANVGTEEYVGEFSVGGGFVNYDIAIGTATTGIVTLTLKFH